MKKLSELANNQMLIYYYDNDNCTVIDKKEFITTPELMNDTELQLCIAHEEKAIIDKGTLEDILDSLNDGYHEDWEVLMYWDIVDSKEFKDFVKLFNKTAENHATFYPDEKVENDMKENKKIEKE